MPVAQLRLLVVQVHQGWMFYVNLLLHIQSTIPPPVSCFRFHPTWHYILHFLTTSSTFKASSDEYHKYASQSHTRSPERTFSQRILQRRCLDPSVCLIALFPLFQVAQSSSFFTWLPLYLHLSHKAPILTHCLFCSPFLVFMFLHFLVVLVVTDSVKLYSYQCCAVIWLTPSCI